MATLALTYFRAASEKVWVAAAALFVLVIALIVRFVRKKKWNVNARRLFSKVILASFAIVFAASVGFVSYDVSARRQMDLADSLGPPLMVSAYVTEIVHQTSWGSIVIVRVREVEGQRVSFDAVLNTSVPMDIPFFEMFEASVVFNELENLPNRFPQRTFYNSRGIFVSANLVGSLPSSGEPVRNVRYVFHRMNRILDTNLMQNLNPETYAFMSGILLGNRDNVPDSLQRDFRVLGLMHVLAISGMHFSILMGVADYIAMRIRVPRKTRAIGMIVLALVYMGICGFTPPITRAGIMFIVYNMAFLLKQQPDSITSLFFAVTVIAIISPWALFNIAMLMSFFGTFGIITFGNAWSGKIREKLADKPLLRTVVTPIVVTLSAIMCVSPVLALYFSAYSIAAPMTNLIFVPIITLMLTIAPIVLLPSIPILTGFVAHILERAYQLIVWLSSHAQYFRWAFFSLEYDFVPLFGILTFALVLGIVVFEIKKKRYKAVPAIVLAASFVLMIGVTTFTRPQAEIIFVNDRNNDYLVLSANGRVALVDMTDGSRSVMNSARGLAAGYTHVPNVDVYILTHLHQRHVGVFYWLANNYFLDFVVLPEPVTESDFNIYGSIRALAKQFGITAVTLEHEGQSAVIYFDGFRFEKFEHEMLRRSTHPVISLQICVGGYSVVYLGASSGENGFEHMYMAREADVVIFGAHGPVMRYGIPERFLCEEVFALFANAEVFANREMDFAEFHVMCEMRNYFRLVVR